VAGKPPLLGGRFNIMRLEPTNVQQIGNELAIAWNDGAESFLKLELLRRACPCAACGGEPDVLGQVVRPHVSYNDKGFELVRFDLVGGYALQPRWADGHSTGIYSFTYLRRLAQHSD
jgi:DUF971 family protein